VFCGIKIQREVTMRQIHILIIDESPDLAKSFGNLIIDVFGMTDVLIKYAYNLHDGLKLVSQIEYHFVFTRAYFSSGDTVYTRSLFKKESINPSVKIIALSFSNEAGFISQVINTGIRNSLIKDQIDVDELAFVFEIMKKKGLQTISTCLNLSGNKEETAYKFNSTI
jgi:DNA-binding NarL/FixJ family response regulator